MGARSWAPRFELADIVRTHRAVLESRQSLTPEQRRVLTDIVQCRTPVLGGHLDLCESCGYEHPSYNSCRDRHCPKCQALAQENWIEQQRARLADVPHFHVVFTLPAELRPLAAFVPRVVYSMLFQCAAATLRAFGQSRLKATIGATLVLHTWTKELHYHPHVHAIVSGGGLRDDGTWVPSQQTFLFPVKAMSRVFRGKMRDALRRAYQNGAFQDFDDFRDPEAFDRLSSRLAKLNWYVYAKRSFSRAKYVLEYLGRYTHRVAISNSRLLDVSCDRIIIRTRGSGRAAMTPIELLQRFVWHVLPKGFHKIRHFGLYATSKAAVPRQPPIAEASHTTPSFRETLQVLTGRDVTVCPRCGCILVTRLLPPERAPPGALAA